MRAVLERIPEGNAGLQVKLQRLRTMVEAAKRDPAFRRFALELVRKVPERDTDGEIAAMSKFTRGLRYTRDPVGVELFTDPRLLADGLLAGYSAGDCDDATGLEAALLETIGHPTRFRCGGYKGLQGQDPSWSHIWLEVLHPRRGWLPLDDTAKLQAPGFDPSPRFEVSMREQRQPQTRPLCYGGACRADMLGRDGLGGFKLKKIGKTLSKVVVRPLTSPLSTFSHVVAKVPGLRQVSSAIARVEDVQHTLLRKASTNPVVRAGAALIPGVGLPIAGGLQIAAFADQISRPSGSPAGNYDLQPIADIISAATGAAQGQQGGEQQGPPPATERPAWFWPAVIGVPVLGALFFLSKKRKRR